ncbi:MAG TPA: hypothetical protein DIS68_05760 [Lachnospiraceae bacterium]|nr:hypothetical protein [Lachnospiraceae bacterium]HAL32278.1 hypothetical protein [Lachnospiraceae bacterium]HBB59037.1 hypothetical protein [Lachnospiraceae bacterium]HCS00299.1 hypothetical protein [Lachnospiraceae bacterium]
MRIWFRQFKENRMVRDITVEDYERDTRTHKIVTGLEKACREMDLSVPIWLDINISDFKRNAKCRFYQDSFVDEIPFDYLEVQVIEEDL